MRKIALDADPGVADALALAFALFDPNVEIVAATSVGGSVDSRTSARNLQNLVAFLDPPRLPRVGVEDENVAVSKINTEINPEINLNKALNSASNSATRAKSDTKTSAPPNTDPKSYLRDKYVKIKSATDRLEASFFNNFNRFNNSNDFNASSDFTLYNDFAFPNVERLTRRSAATILRDAVRSHPQETSILALGPLTNVARAFRRDPELPFLLNRLVVAGGGAIFPPGANATEFNIRCDPQAARLVFQAPCAKTFVPIDAVADLVFSFDDLRTLDSRDDAVGRFLCRSLLEILRARRQTLGSEVVYLQEFAAYFALVEPSLFSTVEARSLDEICGAASDASPDAAPSTFDERRSFDAFPFAERRPDVEIVRQIDVDAVRQKIVAGFQRIAPKTQSPFSP